MLAVATPRADVKSFRLAQPAVQATSGIKLTAFATLSLAAAGIWLLVIPLELLRFAAS
jgi:hypothetical protein